ncbi:odorant receptor Or2-like [Vespa crabro]|uniref:odorant receptor Or2-like n=1 Tax=Vespa crabro TaxID=7445 RepID=UPI001EFF6FAA|nr:odorant receptor Or2-like [Vespa crabro]
MAFIEPAIRFQDVKSINLINSITCGYPFRVFVFQTLRINVLFHSKIANESKNRGFGYLSTSNSFKRIVFAYRSVTLKKKGKLINHIIMKITPETALKFTKRSIALMSSCIVIAAIQVTLKLLVGRLQRPNYQMIIEEMESIIKQASPYERDVLEKYIKKAMILHLSMTFGTYAISANIVLGPLFLPQRLPTYAVYPFDVDKHPAYEFAYFHHVYTGVQCAAGQSIDNFVAVLIWFTSARFEILENEIANIVDESDFKRCILKHINLLSYAEKVIKTVRIVIFLTVGITTILIVFSGLLFVFTDSAAVKAQFLILDILTIIQMFVNSYPAENLIQKSNAIGKAIYNLNWMDNSRKMWQDVCIIIERSQKPVIISIPGFLPAFSLSYYMSYLSSAFSYFTTLRAVMQLNN